MPIKKEESGSAGTPTADTTEGSSSSSVELSDLSGTSTGAGIGTGTGTGAGAGDVKSRSNSINQISLPTEYAAKVSSSGNISLNRFGVTYQPTSDNHELHTTPRHNSQSFMQKTRKALHANAFVFSKLDAKKKDEVYGAVGDFTVLGLIFGGLVLLLGDKVMLVGGPGWSVFILWLCSALVGGVLKKYKIPALLGNLTVGIILKNLPGGLVDGLPKEYATAIRSTGLSLILMRSGLELDVPMVLKQGWIAIRLTVMPGFVEAMTCGGVAVALWDMPPSLGVALGFILAAVSPAVVVSGMFDLQKRGFGVAKGIPSLVVAAASFDDVVAISGYSIAVGFAISTGGSATMSALEGPINIVAGVIVGVAGGLVCSFDRLFNTKTKRVMICLSMGLFLMYLSLKLHYHGAGALAGLMTTITASYCWQNNALKDYRVIKKLGLTTVANHEWHHQTEHSLARLWDAVASPLLFATIGQTIDFSKLDFKVIPAALLVVFCGMCVRVPVAFFATAGKSLTRWERFFVGLAWIPKATVQAALGSVPLDLVLTTMDKTASDFTKYETWGNQILVTAVVAILITAPIGLVCINVFGDRWLNDDINNPQPIEHDDDNDHVNDGESDRSRGSGSIGSGFSGFESERGGGLSGVALELATIKSTESVDTDAVAAGEINANRQKSFVGVAAEYFDKITGGLVSSSTSNKPARRTSNTSQGTGFSAAAQDLENRGKNVYSHHDESWVYSEQRKRMSTADIKVLNRRLSAHYFHNVTNHIEYLDKEFAKIRAGGSANCLDVVECASACARVMEGTIACYKVIAEMEDAFPVEKLYALVDFDAHQSKLNRKAERAAYDYVSGNVFVDESTGADPVQESLATLERRDSNVADVMRALSSLNMPVDADDNAC